jgi:hypothetical protein
MTAFSTILLLGALLSGCFGGVSRDPGQGYKNFQTAVAKAPQDGYAAYWLGRKFRAGGLTFTGPDVADFGTEVTGGGVQMSYNANAGGGLVITLYSDAAWQQGGGTRPLPKNTMTKNVTIKGIAGELFLVPAGTRPVNDVRLNLRLGNTMVEAIAQAGGSATSGGPDANPLIDEQTFLSVMQQLRPYPQ